MNVNQVPSRKVNGKLNQKKSKTSSKLGAEQVEEEDYMYFRTDDGTVCRFGTEGLSQKERVTFGFQDTAAENFEDMKIQLSYGNRPKVPSNAEVICLFLVPSNAIIL